MSSFLAVIPYGIEFKEWVSQNIQALSHITFPLPTEEKEWRTWATYVLFLNPKIAPNTPIPDKRVFPNDEDWRVWASFFISNLPHSL